MNRINILLLLLILSGQIYGITFTGGSLEIQYLSHYGTATNLTDVSELYQEFQINIQGKPNRCLEIRSALKTPWLPVNEINNIDLINWFIQVRYKPYYFLVFQLGDVRVNYSPYTIYTEKWQDNLFKGLMAEITLENLYIHSFIGFHSENTNYIPFQDMRLKSDIGYIYQYYNHNGIIKEQPSIWGGLYFQYSWFDNYKLKLIYAHENYRLDKPDYGYYYFYNNIYQSKINFAFFKWLKLNGMGAVYAQNYKAYNGDWDYYGAGKHRLVFDYSQLEFYPAYECGCILKNPLYKKNYIWGTEISVFYRFIEKEYNPVHMDNGTWEEDRGEDFLNNVYSDRKGFIYRVVQPLYSVLNMGVEHRDFKNIKETSSHWDSRIFIDFHSISDVVDMLLLYRVQKLKRDTFNDGSIQLNGIYANLQFNFNKQWNAGLIYTENKNDIKSYNELIVKLKYRF